MSKAVLVIDMPQNCLECLFSYKSEEMSLGNFAYQSLFRCKFEPERLCEDDGDTVYLNDIMMKSKPNCPLHELMEKKDLKKALNMTGLGWIEGYNACIDEILGDKE